MNTASLIETLAQVRADADRQLVELRRKGADCKAGASRVKGVLLPEVEQHHEHLRHRVSAEFDKLRKALAEREDALLTRLDETRDVKADRLVLAAEQAAAQALVYDQMASTLESAAGRNDDLNLLRAKDVVDKQCSTLNPIMLPDDVDAVAQSVQVNFFNTCLDNIRLHGVFTEDELVPMPLTTLDLGGSMSAGLGGDISNSVTVETLTPGGTASAILRSSRGSSVVGDSFAALSLGAVRDSSAAVASQGPSAKVIQTLHLRKGQDVALKSFAMPYSYRNVVLENECYLTNTEGGSFDSSFGMQILGALTVKPMSRFDCSCKAFRLDPVRAHMRQLVEALSRGTQTSEAKGIYDSAWNSNDGGSPDTADPPPYSNLIVRTHETVSLVSRKGGYKFRNIIIEEGGTLKVDRWDNGTATGGRLVLFAADLILIQGCIDVSGAGYRGGVGITNSVDLDVDLDAETAAAQGESVRGEGELSSDASNGGGGGGGKGCEAYGTTGGSGGGYGLAGEDAPSNRRHGVHLAGQGGVTYGSANLSSLHLGSGGGAGHAYVLKQSRGGHGGRGGGCIHLSGKQVWITPGGMVLADGKPGENGERYGSGGGGGSGGSILVEGQGLTCEGRISTSGGAAGRTQKTDPNFPLLSSFGGKGGSGRIFVSCR